MSISKGKTRVAITVTPDKLKELKIKAAQADLTLSEYLSGAGTIATTRQMETYKNSFSTAGVATLENMNK